MPENDPFDSFKATMTTRASTDLHPLPATEVRRRGDRLRRRNTALAVAGGTLAAVTVIGVPLALVQGGDADRDSLPIATDGPDADPVGWRSDIPEGFPLTDQMPRTNTYSGTPVRAQEGYEPQAPGPCGGEPWQVTGALDTLQAVWQGPEGGMDRTLAVFADDRAAQGRLSDVEEQVRTCSDPRVSTQVVPGNDGESDQSLVFVNAWDDGTAYLHRAVRVGNAVLYTTSYFNGAGDPAVVEETVRTDDAASQAVVDAMCAFAADPC